MEQSPVPSRHVHKIQIGSLSKPLLVNLQQIQHVVALEGLAVARDLQSVDSRLVVAMFHSDLHSVETLVFPSVFDHEDKLQNIVPFSVQGLNLAVYQMNASLLVVK